MRSKHTWMNRTPKYEKLDEPTRVDIAHKTLAETKCLAAFNRYETGYRRQYHKALSTCATYAASAISEHIPDSETPNPEPSPVR